MNLKAMFITAAAVFTSGASIAASPAETKAVDDLVTKLAGTILVSPLTESVEGKTTACGFEFAVLARDFSTKQGAPVKLIGSYYLRANGSDGLGYSLKLGLIDGMGSESRPTAPANAFVRSPKGRAPSAKAVRLDSDTPGYALFMGIVDADTTPTVAAIFDQKKIVLGYNRKPGQTDVLTTLDLRVAETRMVEGEVKRTYSDDAVVEFNQCLGALIERLKIK